MRDRFKVSTCTHWSMQRDNSVIWLLLRFRRRRLGRVYRHSGTRVRSLQDRSTSGRGVGTSVGVPAVGSRGGRPV